MSTMPGFAGSAPTNPAGGASRPLRILFLDDDPERAALFLAWVPGAVWVQTADDCLARLEEGWDEVHLDHDLGGEHFVDFGREDCGMAVVRWLCLVPRPHLQRTRFYVHSHNPNAANLMVMQIYMAGFQVEARPFGKEPHTPSPSPPTSSSSSRPAPRSNERRPSSHGLGLTMWLYRIARLFSGPPSRPG